MGGPVKSEEVIVLDREPSGENLLKMRLFCREGGLVVGMQRVSRSGSPGKNPLPDLFDRLQVQLKAPRDGGDGLYFVGELEVLQRHPGIGRNYAGLQAAVDYARLLIRNATHLEDHLRLFEQTCRLLEVLETTPLPNAAFLKALYIFLREEGYPVKEHWWQTLPPGQQSRAATLLNKPLHAIELDTGTIDAILELLLHWTRTHTDILV